MSEQIKSKFNKKYFFSAGVVAFINLLGIFFFRSSPYMVYTCFLILLLLLIQFISLYLNKENIVFSIIGTLGGISILVANFLEESYLNQFLHITGLLTILGSVYYLYKFIESLDEKQKQNNGSFLIAVVFIFIISTITYTFIFFQNAEESSVSWRFNLVRGQTGKEKIETDSGYAESFKPPKEARKDIRILGIKTETIEKLKGEWPINWKTYAKVIENFKGTSNILFFDIFFLDYKKGQMEELAKAMKGTDNIILDYPIEATGESKELVENLDVRMEALRKFKLKNVVDDGRGEAWLDFANPPIENLSSLSAGIGFANIRRTGDQPNRKMPLVIKLVEHGPEKETEYFPSIDLISVCKYLGVDVVEDTEVVYGKYIKIKNIPNKMVRDQNGYEKDIMTFPNEKREITIPIDYFGEMMINFAGSLFCFADEDVLDVATIWDNETAKQFENQIFLVAMYYATGIGAAKDTHLSPYGEMSGIEHHAHAINTILNQDFLRETTRLENFFIFLVLGLALGIIQPRLPTWISFVFNIALLFIYIVVAVLAFAKLKLIIPIPSAVIEIILIFVTIVGFKVLTEEENVKYIRNTFSKFVSKDVVDELLKNPDKIALGGAKREITVFFSDVRGFTTLSEALSPEELVNLLNEYLSTMTDAIIDYKGTIDKYMGDAIMAFWGAPVDLEDHAYYACVASIMQMQLLHKLQQGWRDRKLPSIDIGIGLNTGPAVVGNMGSSHRMDYTCMGDTVNLGSRLEGSNKTYGTHIIISEYTYEKVKDRIYARELDLVQVKGKTHPVRIYELLGLKNDEDLEKIKRPISDRVSG